MESRHFEFAEPDRFVAGAAGDGERRRFYLQIREAGLLATVAITRGQLTMLALHLATVLDEVSRLAAVDTAEADRTVDVGPLEVPLFALFAANRIQVGWDPVAGVVRVTLADPDLEPPYSLDVLLTPKMARRFGTRADRVVRDAPACPLCAQPISAEGHLCPRLDGYRALQQ
ncbi:MAG TPA: DUF3090 family protein [Propionibacteriaceae bacterium]|nr:DUF3090 family protein [Propionibacteriaceae bacterium]